MTNVSARFHQLSKTKLELSLWQDILKVNELDTLEIKNNAHIFH
jgi:hypothetical protein